MQVDKERRMAFYEKGRKSESCTENVILAG